MNRQVNSSCYNTYEINKVNWFVLPPHLEWYYKQNNPGYKTLPPLAIGCQDNEKVMSFIYPKESNQIYIPIQLDGTFGAVIFEVAHRDQTILHWHLDGEYIGVTEGVHKKEIQASKGKHIVSTVDEKGNKISKSIEIIGKN